MHRIRTTTVALLSSAALTVGVAPIAAQADRPDPAPCAKQERQVQKAEDALARVTAVFAKQKEHVADARQDVKHADNRSERSAAIAALHDAQAKKSKAGEAKKAQQMRLAKANERLESCTAAQETPAS
ncbi:hypothetical protein ASC77_04035 [Nocardioides sp. Root1257]|uniref:hypothetical protein n=1 Tax=unclassified Nocardioides TaxID=2615069 RepID=UPI0006FA8105|nr:MULTISPECIES: hypothetical protein [unclassified Nocardioides]KQW53461.1 hypothetical protein ASC77_04035 [Nocardioides sp. Root1257]KRC56147.1 hypothetical protein ASE24_04035 [Nocardioides sp. Root224]